MWSYPSFVRKLFSLETWFEQTGTNSVQNTEQNCCCPFPSNQICSRIYVRLLIVQPVSWWLFPLGFIAINVWHVPLQWTWLLKLSLQMKMSRQIFIVSEWIHEIMHVTQQFRFIQLRQMSAVPLSELFFIEQMQPKLCAQDQFTNQFATCGWKNSK